MALLVIHISDHLQVSMYTQELSGLSCWDYKSLMLMQGLVFGVTARN